MKENADKNLGDISLADVIAKIKQLNPSEFDKMIIASDTGVSRCDYFYVNYRALSAHRDSLKLTFPVFGSITDNFLEFEGGDAKHGELSKFPSERIIDTLSSKHKIEASTDGASLPSDFNFPIDVDANGPNPTQDLYFIADRTYKEQCDECSGNKIITCLDNECSGRHIWDCVECAAKGQVTCNKCAGNGRLDCGDCSGSKWIRCSSCGGDGKVMDKLDTLSAVSSKSRSTRVVKKDCKKCSGKGRKPCNNCNGGKVTCKKCKGNGKVTCSNCDGHKQITCTECYGDKDRYGMIDCPQCLAQGEMGYISFVKTTLNNHQGDKLFDNGSPLSGISELEILNHAVKDAPKIRTLVNINDNTQVSRDQHVEKYAEQFQSDFSLSLDTFDKILEEELAYQVIPCVTVSYTHMLTNQEHEISVLNFFDGAELKFHHSAEEVKKDVKDATKKVGRFFGKMLKTKKFKSKEDRKKEIRLMIYLAKADGVIEEDEKKFLASSINSIDEFTSTEKSEFFDLMNTPQLPALTKADVTFSSEEKLNEVIGMLSNLAASDGNIEQAEQDLINQIKSL